MNEQKDSAASDAKVEKAAHAIMDEMDRANTEQGKFSGPVPRDEYLPQMRRFAKAALDAAFPSPALVPSPSDSAASEGIPDAARLALVNLILQKNKELNRLRQLKDDVMLGKVSEQELRRELAVAPPSIDEAARRAVDELKKRGPVPYMLCEMTPEEDAEFANIISGAFATTSLVDEAAVRRAAGKILADRRLLVSQLMSDGTHDATPERAAILAEIISTELNLDSGKVSTTPLTDRAEQNTSGEMDACVVTSDGVHRFSEASNGTFCDFCGEPKPNTPPANVERSLLPTQGFTFDHDDIVRAITDIEDARQSHVLWAAHLRNSDRHDCQGCSDHAAHIGDASYHDKWVQKYDHVIRLLAHAPYTRSLDASTVEDAVEQEQGRWQDAIRDKVIKASQIPNADSWVDGAGCDSGDPLDVSLAEIGQVINYLVDELAELRSDASGYVRGLEDAANLIESVQLSVPSQVMAAYINALCDKLAADVRALISQHSPPKCVTEGCQRTRATFGDYCMSCLEGRVNSEA